MAESLRLLATEMCIPGSRQFPALCGAAANCHVWPSEYLNCGTEMSKMTSDSEDSTKEHEYFISNFILITCCKGNIFDVLG